MTCGSSKWVVASTIARARRAGSPDLKIPDPTNTPQSVLDQPGSFFPVGEAIGRTEAKEIYGELLVPLLSGKPGAQSLSLEIGYRTTDNDPTEDVDTYKALVDWAIVDRVRFRGGRQIAKRAPNIGELFQASEQFAPFTFVQGDPCSTRNPAQLPYTANPTINGARAARVRALCEALMGPAGAANYYGDPSLQPNTLQSPRISNLIGNPNLKSEKAETITAGFVIDVAEEFQVSASTESGPLQAYQHEMESNNLDGAANALAAVSNRPITEELVLTVNERLGIESQLIAKQVAEVAASRQNPGDITYDTYDESGAVTPGLTPMHETTARLSGDMKSLTVSSRQFSAYEQAMERGNLDLDATTAFPRERWLAAVPGLILSYYAAAAYVPEARRALSRVRASERAG